LTTLDWQVARGKADGARLGCARPEGDSELGAAAETGVSRSSGQRMTHGWKNLGYIEHHEERRLVAETLALMDRGTQVIAQGALSGREWFGRPDVLRRVEKAEQAVDLVVQVGRHEAGARDESNDNPATVAVLGFA